MNKKALVVGLALLEDAYEKFDVIKHERRLHLWQTMFKDDDEQVFLDAVKAHIESSVYLPSIAAIKQQMKEATALDATTAWELVRQAIRDNKFYRGMPEFDDPVLNKTLKGWSYEELDMMKTEDAGYMRSQFLKAFNANRENAGKKQLPQGALSELTRGMFKDTKEE